MIQSVSNEELRSVKLAIQQSILSTFGMQSECTITINLRDWAYIVSAQCTIGEAVFTCTSEFCERELYMRHSDNRHESAAELLAYSFFQEIGIKISQWVRRLPSPRYPEETDREYLSRVYLGVECRAPFGRDPAVHELIRDLIKSIASSWLSSPTVKVNCREVVVWGSLGTFRQMAVFHDIASLKTFLTTNMRPKNIKAVPEVLQQEDGRLLEI